MALSDMSMIVSGAGRKEDKVHLFTDFHHYSFAEINELILVAMGETKFSQLQKSCPEILKKACYMLQGRPRIISTFVEDLQLNGETKTFEQILSNYLNDIMVKDTELKSFRWFWARVLQSSTLMHDFATGEHGDAPRVYLFELLEAYLFREVNEEFCEIMVSTNNDLIGTGLVSIKTSPKEKLIYIMIEPVVIATALLMMSEKDLYPTFQKNFLSHVTTYFNQNVLEKSVLKVEGNLLTAMLP